MRRNREWTAAGFLTLVTVTLAALIVSLKSSQARKHVEEALNKEQVAKVAAVTALQAEEKANEDALERLRGWMDTTQTSLTGVNEVLQDYPGSEPMRRVLLEKAAEDFERMATHTSSAPALIAESARSRVRLGDLRCLLNEVDEAKEQYDQARDTFTQLLLQHADDSELKLARARTNVRIGLLQTSIGQHAAADEAFQAAFTELDELTKTDAENIEFQHDHAAALYDRALLLIQVGTLDDALKHLQEATDAFRLLAKEERSVQNREGLAMSQRELGHVLFLLGKHAEAIQFLRESIDDYVAMLANNSDNLRLREGLAASRMHLANASRSGSRYRDVVAIYESSVADYKLLLEARPGIPKYRENVAVGKTNIAQVLHRHGRSDKAKDTALEAVAELIALVDQFGMVPRYREEKATCYTLLGMILRDLNDFEVAEQAFQGALEEFARLRDQNPDVIFYRRRMAICFSGIGRLRQRQELPDEAKLLLKRAVSELESVISEGLDDVHSHDAMAWAKTHLGDLLQSMDQSETAAVYFQEAREIRERFPAAPEQTRSYVRLLLEYEHPKVRDPRKAFDKAQELVSASPHNADYRYLLALAHYRNDNPDNCIAILRVAMEHRDDPKSEDHLLMSMAQFAAGDKVDARHHFDVGGELLRTHSPGRMELLRLREEAARKTMFKVVEPEAKK